VLHHDLDAALRDLGQADEGRVSLLPVRVDGPLGQRRGGDGHDRGAAQGQRDAVQALLPELVQLALAVRLVRVGLRLVPLRLVLCASAANSDAEVRGHVAGWCWNAEQLIRWSGTIAATAVGLKTNVVVVASANQHHLLGTGI